MGGPAGVSASLISIQQGHMTAAYTPSLDKIFPQSSYIKKFVTPPYIFLLAHPGSTSFSPQCLLWSHAAVTVAQPGASVAGACTGNEGLQVGVITAPSTGSGTSHSSAIMGQSTGARDGAGSYVSRGDFKPLPASSTQHGHHYWVWVLRTLLQTPSFLFIAT